MKNLDKLLSWLQTSEYDGVILGRRDNFKWITEENANAVVTNTEVGVAHLLIEKDGSVTVAADSSDCPRMETEQNALRAKGMLIPWYESFEAHLKDYIGDRTFASDTGIAGTDNVQSELIDVRMQLSEKELMERGVTLGADVPYCIMRGTALAEGIGEKLTRLPGTSSDWFVSVPRPNGCR